MMEGPSLTGLKDGSFETLEFQVDLNGILPAELASLHAGDFASLSFTSDINGVTPAELSYVQGATSSLQSQINGLVAGSLGSSDLNVNSLTATTSISAATLSVGGVSYTTTLATKQDTLTTSSTPYVQDIRLTTADSMGGAVNNTGFVGIQLQDLWDRAGDLGSDITTLQTDLGTLEGTVSGLDTDLTSVETDVATLQTEMLTKIESLEIGTVTSVSYGTAPTVTIDNITDPLHPTISFELQQGNPGPTGATGPTGPQGPAGSDADVGPLAVQVAVNTAGIAAGAVVATGLQAQISAVAATAAANNAAIATVATEVATLDGEVTTLMAKTVNIASATPGTNTNLTGTLTVKDPTGFSSRVVLGSTIQSQFYLGLNAASLSTGGNLTVAGDVTVSGDSNLGGFTTCTAGLQVNGDSAIEAALGVTGHGTFESGLSVTEDVTIGGTCDVTGGATFASTVGITGELTVSADSNLVNVDATGNVQIGGTLDCTGDVTCAVLTATSSLSTSFLEATGSTELGGDFGTSLATHVINGASLTVNCALVSIPALSLSGFFSQLEGYTLTL